MDEKFLLIIQVNDLLPQEYKIDTENRIERFVYRRIDGNVLPIINLKKYDTDKEPYLYSCLTDYFKQIGASHICLTCGNDGILLVPIDTMLAYNKHSGWKTKIQKGKSYHIRVKIKQDKFILHCSEENDNIDVTEYYISKSLA